MNRWHERTEIWVCFTIDDGNHQTAICLGKMSRRGTTASSYNTNNFIKHLMHLNSILQRTRLTWRHKIISVNLVTENESDVQWIVYTRWHLWRIKQWCGHAQILSCVSAQFCEHWDRWASFPLGYAFQFQYLYKDRIQKVPKDMYAFFLFRNKSV